MAHLGDLERAVMDVVWDADDSLTAYDVKDALEAQGRDLAATTLLTVLSRLDKKGFVTSDRSARPHRYQPVGTREAHMAELMHEVLGETADRSAVLARFIGGVSAEDQATLRNLLAS
ncbi:BlaI/MecI/CopY family transcriptional regulator [Microbacterium halophytorum]|uniref:BlaI/MecI/CopY family transcriptional regulator n=1 Tax=Microbacterium halophytorum TaxID=2067568 RepID=UPI000CFD0876|nr:BlaI/MecI/CopY family transcriptional regulator [Microbacterium halophytorum]